MSYTLKTTNQYTKQLKKCIKRGCDESKLEEVVNCLLDGRPLPEKHHAHRLSAKFGYCWECHITPDWLLLWDYDDDDLILLFCRLVLIVIFSEATFVFPHYPLNEYLPKAGCNPHFWQAFKLMFNPTTSAPLPHLRYGREIPADLPKSEFLNII